ncbi:MAG: lamin tail domain-containing protein, partial [Candidatus Magasanikbacteria bacterium]|nr:lamin tail domain-containing protein [Candidatus Magasanikbacteria bacterium]
MKARKRVFVLMGMLVFLWGSSGEAATQSDVIINEIAWMGMAASANDEWIELKNTTDKTISLKGWTLKNADGKISIPLKGQIPAQGFYLLERTDDNSVANTKADMLYKGSLRNGGDSLQLSAGANALVDSTAFASSWPAGNNDTKQTMERTSEGLPAQAGWQTSKDAGGTPKAANSIVI